MPLGGPVAPPDNWPDMKSIAIIVLVALAIGVLGYKAWSTRSAVDGPGKSTVDGRQSTGTEAKGSSPGPAAPAEQASGCEKSLAELRKLFDGIPDDFRKARSIEDLTTTTRACRDLGEAFLGTCKASPDAHLVQFMVARCILILNRVEWVAYYTAETKNGKSASDVMASRDAWTARYFGRVIDLATASLEKLEAGKPERAKCLDILAGSLYQSGKPAAAFERYVQLLKEFPEYPDRATTYQAMARCHEDLGSFRDGIALIRKAMAEVPRGPNYPFFYEFLWRLHLGAGDLPGLLKVVEETQDALKERLKATDLTQDEKESAERFLFYSGFRLGYIRFALGDFAGALDAFRAHCTPYEDPQKKGALPQDYQVQLGRSKDNLDVLAGKIGKPQPATLDRVLWAGGRRPELAGGKTLAIIFRQMNDERSAKFVQAIDAHWRKHRERYDLVTISFLQPDPSPSIQAEQAFQEAESLGVSCPIGLDPDSREKQLFKDFNAIVGTATLAIIDRSGNYVWFQQDPWQRDVAFSTAILERFIAP
jgi:hypothetical protein